MADKGDVGESRQIILPPSIGKLANVKVNLTRLMVTKDLFGPSVRTTASAGTFKVHKDETKDDDDDDDSSARRIIAQASGAGNSNASTTTTTTAAAARSKEDSKNRAEKERRQANLSRLMVTKGLFDKPTEPKDIKNDAPDAACPSPSAVMPPARSRVSTPVAKNAATIEAPVAAPARMNSPPKTVKIHNNVSQVPAVPLSMESGASKKLQPAAIDEVIETKKTIAEPQNLEKQKQKERLIKHEQQQQQQQQQQKESHQIKQKEQHRGQDQKQENERQAEKIIINKRSAEAIEDEPMEIVETEPPSRLPIKRASLDQTERTSTTAPPPPPPLQSTMATPLMPPTESALSKASNDKTDRPTYESGIIAKSSKDISPPTQSLKVTSNFKIPKKQAPFTPNYARNNRKEFEDRRQERRRDITAQSGTRHVHRQERDDSHEPSSSPSSSSSRQLFGESRKGAAEYKDSQTVFDYAGRRRRTRGGHSARYLGGPDLKEKETPDAYRTAEEGTGILNFSDSTATIVRASPVPSSQPPPPPPPPPPTQQQQQQPEVDVVRCTNQYSPAIALVDSWLHVNPVGQKSNAAGEVYVSPKKLSKDKGQMATTLGGARGILESTNPFGLNIARCMDEEPMVVDTEEFICEIQQFRKQTDCEPRMICGQLTQLRSQMRDEPMSIDANNADPDAKRKNRRKKIHIVLDTNVLLSDLYMVDELMRSRPFKGPDASGATSSSVTPHIVLVVPWVVLQELDGLKSNRRETPSAIKLRELASKAVRYLHDLFTNAHPQVRGQTSRDAVADVGVTIECNDDKVLQCCVLFKKKGMRRVILLSNDRNLCSKAIVHKIPAYTKDNIKRALDKIDPPPAVFQSRQAPELTEEASRDKILRSYKSVILSVFGDIVKHEMQEIYGDMWLKVVLIRPPWSNPLDVLRCLDKHWLAVFGHCVNRRAKIHMDLVFQKMKALGARSNYDEMKFIFAETLKLLSYFEARVAISTRAKEGMQLVRELLKELTASRKDHPNSATHADASNAAQKPQQQHAAGPSGVLGAAVEDGQQQNSQMADEISPAVPAIPPDPLQLVYGVFQKVWSSINHICGSIYDSFGLPNPISYIRPPVVPSAEECFHFIPRFYPVITEIRDLVRRILRMPLDVDSKEPEFTKLYHRLINYFSALGISSEFSFDEPISPEMLHFFCTTYEKRELLGRGLIQLEECCAYIFRLILTIKDWEI